MYSRSCMFKTVILKFEYLEEGNMRQLKTHCSVGKLLLNCCVFVCFSWILNFTAALCEEMYLIIAQATVEMMCMVLYCRHLNGCMLDAISRPHLLITDSFNADYMQTRRMQRDEQLLSMQTVTAIFSYKLNWDDVIFLLLVVSFRLIFTCYWRPVYFQCVFRCHFLFGMLNFM